jgi:hypothetical protein
VADAVLGATVAGLPQTIRELDAQGCPAAGPLLQTLGTLQPQGDLDSSAAIVNALGRLAARDTRESCGCPELLSVLAVENVKTRYCMTTHRAVLRALARLSCREKRRVICNYVGKIEVASTLTSVMCEGEEPVQPQELRPLASQALGDGAAPCPGEAGRP